MHIPKLSDQAVKLICNLNDDERELVNQKLRTHFAACLRNGAPIENVDRLVIEAVEVMRLEAREPQPALDVEMAGMRGWPAYSYPQYVSPRGDN